MRDDLLCPRIPSLASMFECGTAHVPDVAPAVQSDAETVAPAVQDVKEIHDEELRSKL